MDADRDTCRYFVFEPFRLDVLDERLWRRDRPVPLGQKARGVLQRLLRDAGRLVTKDDLLATAWPDTAVSDAVLTTAVRELRDALGDAARAPRFVQTVHGRGYRFIAPVMETEGVPLTSATAEQGASAPRAVAFVGRDPELTQLREWHAAALRGSRRVVFVTGDAGIGKTALVEAFVAEVRNATDSAARRATIARGQCIDHYGAGEAYLPVLEALGRLGRDVPMPTIDLLRAHAPSWLAHLPSLRPDSTLHADDSAEEAAPSAPPARRELATPLASVAPARMLRELAELLERLTARDPLILVVEDLHWSDAATLDALAYLARRRDSARLLVIGTSRPVETLSSTHPLRAVIAELAPQAQRGVVTLDGLSRESVAMYVRGRAPDVATGSAAANAIDVLYRRTGGHPLFLTTLVEALPRGEMGADAEAVARVVPASIRQFIERRLDVIAADDMHILDAASVAGDPFSIAAIVAATDLAAERIDACCAVWTQPGGFLIADGLAAWPDGTQASRYRFRHALFQEVIYARISPERRSRLHLAIGQRLETAFRKRAALPAAELARHFEQGRDIRRAVSYAEQAARTALQRAGHVEAERHLTSALALIDRLPDGRDRLRRELTLSLLLAQTLESAKGWSAPEVERLYARARVLCDTLHDDDRRLQATWGLLAVSLVRGEWRKTQALGHDVLRLAKTRRDPVFRMAAHMELGGTALALGDADAARTHFREAEARYDPRHHRSHLAAFGADLGLFARIWSTHMLWQHGFPDRARRVADDTLRAADERGHPFTRVIVLAYATMLAQFQRDIDEAARLASATIAHASEYGFAYYLAWAEVIQGWSRAVRDDSAGLDQMRRAIGVLRASAGVRLPYYRSLLADACGHHGLIDEAFTAIETACAEVQLTEECWWEPELHRRRGELLLRGSSRDGHAEADAEMSFRIAIDRARAQQARMLELRAAVSLARWLREQGRDAEARDLVAPLHATCTEGFNTRDLQDAAALLDPLSTHR